MFASAFRSCRVREEAPAWRGTLDPEGAVERSLEDLAVRAREEVRHDTVCERSHAERNIRQSRAKLACAALARSIRIGRPASACASIERETSSTANASASVRTCSVDVRSRNRLGGREGDETGCREERGERNDQLPQASRREADGSEHTLRTPSHRERGDERDDHADEEERPQWSQEREARRDQ